MSVGLVQHYFGTKDEMLLHAAVHNGKECGEVEPDLDEWPAAVRLTAVTEGLAMQVYRDPAG